MSIRSKCFVLLALGAAIALPLPSATAADGPAKKQTAARETSSQATGVKEIAAFPLDEVAGSRRVVGGEAQEFTAALAGGAESGVVGKVG
ncbi:hypothetical protein, partial [Streptomyces sp. KL109B]|uniref:hypothetical protein n=1 Tax=Streptomyces sp. KL109B TaxID=3045155 RepID=UPI00278C4C2F